MSNSKHDQLLAKIQRQLNRLEAISKIEQASSKELKNIFKELKTELKK